MSSERKNPLKRDQALNDATNGQFGEQPRPEPLPEMDIGKDESIQDSQRKAARKMSRSI
jgi:hypothetical protein